MAKILIVDDESGIREFLGDALELAGHQIEQADSGEKAIALLRSTSFSLVFTDLKMPGISGMDLLHWIREEQPEVEVIMLTAHGSINAAVEAMKSGAFEFLQKPISGIEELQLLAARALERRQLRAQADSTQRQAPDEVQLSYGDPAMQMVSGAIAKVAQTNATVLLLGESGSGKEVAAKTVHQQSPRHDKPFMAINCAALTETLLESELFGHEKGAFTGASERRRGRIELAEGGTFFLDEVGELKMELQAKLLRVLQERKFVRVGGAQSIDADVRWVAATNRDLKAMIARGEFREDLYHRLAVFPIKLPPLRERKHDLPYLAQLLLRLASKEMGRPGLSFTKSALQKIQNYTWPGNIRELKNAIERAAILADSTQITPQEIWLESIEAGVQTAEDKLHIAQEHKLVQPLAELEKQAIVATLAEVGGNRRQAAKLLEIGERTLYDKIKRYGLA